MDELVSTFLAVTGIEDESTAKQYLEITNNDLEYAVTLYMESNPPANASGQNASHGDDEELAQRLQQEAYGNEGSDVREADTNIHRHETLVDSFGGGFTPSPHISRPGDIFGAGRVGVFNQRYDGEGDEFHFDRFEELPDDDDDEEEDDDDEVMVLDNDGEVVENDRERPRSRRRMNRNDRMSELTSTQRRLANLFKPPFDIMSKIDLDAAKTEGRRLKKWILINIQDSSEFTCQVLNRDFWSQLKIKNVVRDHFIFLQYQHDSPNGTNYKNFYSIDKYPHISILDPLTGERVFKWTDGEIPEADTWLEEVDQFLDKFSLLPNSNNPIINHEAKFDPDALSEEQQIEFAMKQSIIDNQTGGTTSDDAIEVDETNQIDASDNNSVPEEEGDKFSSIQTLDHEEPSAGNSVTRMQIRFPNGKRLIHKFDLDEDTVLTVYQWLKYIVANSEDEYGLSKDDRFILSNVSNKAKKSLIDSLDSTINEAELKNASILLEKE